MALELDVRIALIENHQVFKKLGFEVPKEGFQSDDLFHDASETLLEITH